jgi:adenine phosphoribosyltransferase
LAEPFKKDHVTKVLGVEARGFLLAGAVARELKAGVAPVRKHGAIFPGPHLSVKTSPDYRGRSIDLLVQTGSLSDKDRVLLVDDWLETGSQLLGAVDLVHKTGAHLIGAAVIVDQSDGSVSTPGLHALIPGELLGSSDRLR